MNDTKYRVLAVSCDTFVATQGNNAGKSYECRYCVIKKSDNVKPISYKCTESVLATASKLIGKNVLLSFDEHCRINGITEDKPVTTE